MNWQLFPLTRGLLWAAHIASALLLVSVFQWFAVPAALLIGPLVAGACAGLARGGIKYPRWAMSMAQAVTGVLVATSLRPDTLETLARIWPAAVLLLCLIMASAVLAGVAVGKAAAIDREAAIWGFLPGMASAVIAMSDDQGLDARLVAVIQLVRIIVVIFLTAGLVATVGLDAPRAVTSTTEVGGLGLLLGLIALGPIADRWLRVIPAAALLVPLTVGASLKLAGVALTLPHLVLAVAYLVIGANIGLGFDRSFLKHAARVLPYAVAASALLYIIGAVLSLGLAYVGGIDPLSALLATVPGSIDAIAAIAYSEGADVSVVMSIQIMRLFAVVLIGPFMARWAIRWALKPQ